MNRSSRLPVYPRRTVERRRAIAGGALVVFTVAAFYLVPLGIFAVCFRMGWYSA